MVSIPSDYQIYMRVTRSSRQIMTDWSLLTSLQVSTTVIGLSMPDSTSCCGSNISTRMFTEAGCRCMGTQCSRSLQLIPFPHLPPASLPSPDLNPFSQGLVENQKYGVERITTRVRVMREKDLIRTTAWQLLPAYTSMIITKLSVFACHCDRGWQAHVASHVCLG